MLSTWNSVRDYIIFIYTGVHPNTKTSESAGFTFWTVRLKKYGDNIKLSPYSKPS